MEKVAIYCWLLYFKISNDVWLLKKYEKFILLLRKGAMCSKYFDSWDKYNNETLPPKKKFFNKLKQKGTIGRHCKYTQRVNITLNMKNLGEYIDVYCIIDCTLLFFYHFFMMIYQYLYFTLSWIMMKRPILVIH